MKAALNKIEAIKALKNELDNQTAHAEKLQEDIWTGNDNAPIDWAKHSVWCAEFDKKQALERKYNAAVRSLAKMLGFSIKPNKFGFKTPMYDEVFDAICTQVDKAMQALHEIGWNGWGSEYIDNAVED